MVVYKSYVELGNTFDLGVEREHNPREDIDGDNRQNVSIICDNGSIAYELDFDGSYGETLYVFSGEAFNYARVNKIRITALANNTRYRIEAGTASGLF